MKYTILFTKMLFISFLVMTMGMGVLSCSDDEDELQVGYGYAQFKLYKSASYEKPCQTRATANKLDSLSEAQKMKIVLINNNDGTEVVQTVGLGATTHANAEFGLRSEKLQLLAGEYTVVGFYLYKIEDGDMNKHFLSGEPAEKTVITIVSGGLTTQDITVNAVERGSVKFILKKDIEATTRGASDAPGTGAYLFEDIKYVNLSIRNKFLGGANISYSKLPVTYTEKVEKEGEAVFQYAVSICDSLLYLRAGTYEVVSYTLLDRSENPLERINNSSVSENEFVIEDNKTTEAYVPVYLKEMAAKLKDYHALKEIWKALGGENWSYSGSTYPSGSNWDFNKEMDMWGDQPGVDVNSEGRVTVLNLGSFGAKGKVPEAIGQLTELKILTLGTHSDKVGENIFETVGGGELTETKIEMLRADYYNKFLKTDVCAQLSEPLQRALELKNKPVEHNKYAKTRPGISLKDVGQGVKTNGITGIHKNIEKLTKLQQLFIANGDFEDFDPEVNWSKLENLTDVELYNCTKMTRLPEALFKLPNIVSLNIACNPQITADDIYEGVDELAKGKSKETLQILYLGGNNLKKVPESFINFKKLGKLDCSYNQIEEIPAFGKNVSFVQLSMAHNKIKKIPADFCGYEDVESFSFAYNELTELPNIFDATSPYVMGSVDFSFNKISKIEGVNGDDYSNYKGINASTVSLTGNKLTTFPTALIAKNSPIGVLNLSGNGMTDFPDGSLKEGTKLYMLQTLDLTYNKLTKLPKEFNAIRLPYLYGLDISNNRLTEFPKGPLNIDHLTALGVSNQRDEDGNRTISDWPTGIYMCPSLRILYVGGNDLRKITDTISPNIYIFEIRDNPNISITLPSTICTYIKSGYYQLIYDRTQDIRGCDYLDLE